MYTVKNQEVEQKLESYGRVFGIWLEDTGSGEVILGDVVFNANSEHSSTSLSDDIELGAICSQTWTVSVVGADGQYVGREFKLSFYLKDFTKSGTTYGDLKRYSFGELKKLTVSQVGNLGEILAGELIPMGTFTCVKAPKSGDGRELTLCDKLYFSDKIYERNISLPATASEVERDVCRQLGLDCANNSLSGRLDESGGKALYESGGKRLAAASFDFEIKSIKKGMTCREMLSYIASARGRFGVVDRFGEYVTKWYTDSGFTIDGDRADEPTVSEKPNVIVGIRCTVSDGTTLIQGAESGGRILEFENPYMTDGLLASIFTRVRGYTWYTSSVRHRLGDPRLDIGDVVHCDDYAVPVTGLAFSFDGGLMADITAVGLNEEEQII